MILEFVKDYVGHHAGDKVAADVLGGGVVELLLTRGVVGVVSPAPVAEVPTPPQAPPKPRARPKPKKPARR